MTDQYADEKRWVFSFDFKENSEVRKEKMKKRNFPGYGHPALTWKTYLLISHNNNKKTKKTNLKNDGFNGDFGQEE